MRVFNLMAAMKWVNIYRIPDYPAYLYAILGRILKSFLRTLINEFHQSLNFEKHFAYTLCKLNCNKFKISNCVLYLKYILKIHVLCIRNSVNLKSILYFVSKRIFRCILPNSGINDLGQIWCLFKHKEIQPKSFTLRILWE